jgi:hypothetical protein
MMRLTDSSLQTTQRVLIGGMRRGKDMPDDFSRQPDVVLTNVVSKALGPDVDTVTPLHGAVQGTTEAALREPALRPRLKAYRVKVSGRRMPIALVPGRVDEIPRVRPLRLKIAAPIPNQPDGYHTPAHRRYTVTIRSARPPSKISPRPPPTPSGSCTTRRAHGRRLSDGLICPDYRLKHRLAKGIGQALVGDRRNASSYNGDRHRPARSIGRKDRPRT